MMITATKHTPGPWVLDGFNMAAVIRCTAERGSPEAKHTCGDYETVARCEGDNWSPNARLIAAAPELLAAIKHLHAVMACHDGTPEELLALSLAEEVILTAEGGRS